VENTNFGKKAIVPVKKSIWKSSPIIEHGKIREQIIKVPNVFLTVIVQNIGLFLKDLRGREKQTFQQSLSSRNKRSWPVLSRII